MKPDLGDVVVRARGLANHLLPRQVLERLARSPGMGPLARALQELGYGPRSREGGVRSSAAAQIDESIAQRCQRRLDVLASWLGERRPLFAGVFEDEERSAIRVWLRRASSGGPTAPDAARPAGVPDLVRSLARRGSPYAEALEGVLRAQGDVVMALEAALDATFARRARLAAERLGGRLLAWVADGIDLANAWDALLGGGGDFVEGGRRLGRERHASIQRETSQPVRRRQLAAVFGPSPLAAVFDDPGLPLAALEARATALRIAQERRAARLEPLGAAPILEVVMRLRAERSDLRRVNWGVEQGLPPDAIIGQLTVAQP